MFSLNMLEQPEVWSVVCEQCLKQIKDVTNRLSNKDGLTSNIAPVSTTTSTVNDTSNQPFAPNFSSQCNDYTIASNGLPVSDYHVLWVASVAK